MPKPNITFWFVFNPGPCKVSQFHSKVEIKIKHDSSPVVFTLLWNTSIHSVSGLKINGALGSVGACQKMQKHPSQACISCSHIDFEHSFICVFNLCLFVWEWYDVWATGVSFSFLSYVWPQGWYYHLMSNLRDKNNKKKQQPPDPCRTHRHTLALNHGHVSLALPNPVLFLWITVSHHEGWYHPAAWVQR